MLVVTQSTRASSVPEPFAANNYVVGNALTSFYWTGSSAGALTIDNGPTMPNSSRSDGKAVRLNGGGSDVTATASGWGGPGRNVSGTEPENGRAYYSIDVFKGTGTATDPVWKVTYRSSTQNIVELKGGLGTVQLLVYDGTPALVYTGPLINLLDGWNNVCVINDTTSPTAPADGKNVHLYVNTELDANGAPLSDAVDGYNVANGPLTSNTTCAVATMLLTRLGATGTATMYLDNVVAGNTNIDPTNGDLIGWSIYPGTYKACYAAPVPAPTDNGWDMDYVYVIKQSDSSADTGLYSSWYGGVDEVRKSTGVLNRQKLVQMGQDSNDTTQTFDVTKPLSLTFSNAEEAGVNSPKGARLFGTWGYSSVGSTVADHNQKTDMFVQEYGIKPGTLSTIIPFRKFYLGDTFEGHHGGGKLVVLLPAPPAPPEPNNEVLPGNIRFNPKKNTLAIGAVLRTDDGGTATVKVFEFELPDWVRPNPATSNQQGAVKAVQTYVAPVGHTTQNNNGIQKVFIDFDNDGNLYVGGRRFDANPPGGGGDVVRINTLGRTGGGETVMVLSGPDKNADLLIDGAVEGSQNAAWDNRSLAVRTTQHQLVVFSRLDGESDNIHFARPAFLYDLNQTHANGNLLLLKEVAPQCESPSDWFTGCNPGVGRSWALGQRDEATGGVFMTASEFFGTPNGTQLLHDDYPTDSVAINLGTIYRPSVGAPYASGASMDAASPPPPPGAAEAGACCLPGHTCSPLTQAACNLAGGLWHGEGTTCGQFPCEGACCLPNHTCESRFLPDCVAGSGYFQGLGTVCGESPCEGACCDGPCQACSQTIPGQCTGTGKTFQGLGAICGATACPVVCAAIPVDGDCDGDLDLEDFANFQLCYNPGAPIPGTPNNCACFDRADPLGQIDHFDFDAFVNCAGASRSTVPAVPCP